VTCIPKDLRLAPTLVVPVNRSRALEALVALARVLIVESRALFDPRYLINGSTS
jgi:hypothetical protein